MKKLILPIALLISLNLQAQIDTLNQTVVASSGEVLQSPNYLLSFTLGEVVIETFEAVKIILSQGFHQADLVIVNGIPDYNPFKGEVLIYPNPLVEVLHIDIRFDHQENLEINVLDISGKRLKKAKHTLSSGIINLEFNNYPSGHYLIEIISHSSKKYQTYKIIKK